MTNFVKPKSHMGQNTGQRKPTSHLRSCISMNKNVDKSESAIAPIVAVLLILSILLTVVSLIYTIYIPNLREEAEISHLADVERTLLAFSSEIDDAVSNKNAGKWSKTVKLGGGDTFLSPIRSGGYIEIFKDKEIYNLTISGITSEDELIPTKIYNSTLTGFKYQAIGNFWQNVGYEWKYGYLSLITYTKTTPVHYTDIKEVTSEITQGKSIFSSLFDLDVTKKPAFERDNEGNLTGKIYENISEITITLVSFNSDKQTDKTQYFISGNSVANLCLSADIDNYVYDATEITLKTNSELEYYADIPVWKCINSALLKLTLDPNIDNLDKTSSKCFNNPEISDCNKDLSLRFYNPVIVNVKIINLSILV